MDRDKPQSDLVPKRHKLRQQSFIGYYIKKRYILKDYHKSVQENGEKYVQYLMNKPMHTTGCNI